MQEYRKSKQIMNELLDYCVSHGMTDAKINFKLMSDRSEIAVRGNLKGIPADIKEVVKKLKAPGQPELEEYYDDLLGLREGRFNVNIMAGMIDEVAYNYDDGEFEIAIVSQKD